MSWFMAVESWTTQRRIYVEADNPREAARLLKRGGEVLAEEEDGERLPGRRRLSIPVPCDRPTGKLRRL